MYILVCASQDNALAEDGITVKSIAQCESFLLSACNWKPLIPTCTEILKLLLNVVNYEFDFSEIIENSNKLIFSCLLSQDLAKYKYSTIALTSLLLALDDKHYISFLNGVLEFVYTNSLKFDIAECRICWEAILSFVNESPEDGPESSSNPFDDLLALLVNTTQKDSERADNSQDMGESLALTYQDTIDTPANLSLVTQEVSEEIEEEKINVSTHTLQATSNTDHQTKTKVIKKRKCMTSTKKKSSRFCQSTHITTFSNAEIIRSTSNQTEATTDQEANQLEDNTNL